MFVDLRTQKGLVFALLSFALLLSIANLAFGIALQFMGYGVPHDEETRLTPFIPILTFPTLIFGLLRRKWLRPFMWGLVLLSFSGFLPLLVQHRLEQNLPPRNIVFVAVDCFIFFPVRLQVIVAFLVECAHHIEAFYLSHSPTE